MHESPVPPSDGPYGRALTAAEAERPDLGLGATACWSLLVAGLIAWAWSGEWRWALTGAGVGLIAGLVGVAVRHRRDAR